VEVLPRVGIEQGLLEKLNAVGEKAILHDHEPTVVVVLILPDQVLALISRRVARLVERRADGHRPMKRDCQEIGRPRLSKVAGRSPRAFRACSRACLAISMHSRQSGSNPDGGDTAGDRSELEEAVSFCARGLVMLGLLGSKRE